MPSMPKDAAAVVAAAREVCQEHKADVILFNQPINSQVAIKLHEQLESEAKSKDSVFVILSTFGGDAHAAYLIGRELQLRYPKVILCIAGDCYSAGTLITLCAHELVIADRGRLGPVDVQLRKKDEIMERLSGLTMGTAIEELQRKAGKAVIETAMQLTMELKGSSLGHLSFRTALDVSANMVARMYGEVFKQIDPMKLGEDAMALEIAKHYGRILSQKSANLKRDAIDRLVEEYPSHECIIDREEAKELFVNLRDPGANELKLLQSLGTLATDAKDRGGILLVFPCDAACKNDSNKEATTSGKASEPAEDKPNGRKRSNKSGDAEVAGRRARTAGEDHAEADSKRASPN